MHHITDLRKSDRYIGNRYDLVPELRTKPNSIQGSTRSHAAGGLQSPASEGEGISIISQSDQNFTNVRGENTFKVDQSSNVNYESIPELETSLIQISDNHVLIDNLRNLSDINSKGIIQNDRRTSNQESNEHWITADWTKAQMGLTMSPVNWILQYHHQKSIAFIKNRIANYIKS